VISEEIVVSEEIVENDAEVVTEQPKATGKPWYEKHGSAWQGCPGPARVPSRDNPGAWSYYTVSQKFVKRSSAENIIIILEL